MAFEASSSLLTVVKESENEIHAVANPTEGLGRDTGSSALAKYEPIGAVPTRILEPSPDHSFTCYTYSDDGTRLATGDTDGTVRVWTTADYDEAGACYLEKGVPVSALSFFDGSSEVLVAVDRRGNLRKLSCPIQGTAGVNHRLEIIQTTRAWSLSDDTDDAGRNDLFKHQFSSDGLILAHSRGEKHPRTGRFDLEGVDVYQLKNGFDPPRRIHNVRESHDFEFTVPVLSKNGNSLLFCSFDKWQQATYNGIEETNFMSHILVVPALIPESGHEPEVVHLSGERATWGLDGKYVMVWDIDTEKRPRLSIYRTSDIARDGASVKPFAKTPLRLGLFAWKAVMLGSQDSDDSVRVLIYEITEAEDRRFRRFFVWDTKNIPIVNEVHMNMHQRRNVDGMESTSAIQQAYQLVECGLPMRSYDGFYYRVIADLFPSFCASKGEKWIGAFSWRRHGGGISSMRAGVTVWKFRLPQGLKFNPLLLPNQTMFDPGEKHFMIFGSSGIIACMPSFLDGESLSPLQERSLSEPVIHSISESMNSSILDCCDALPSAAVAKKVMIHLRHPTTMWQRAWKGGKRTVNAMDLVSFRKIRCTPSIRPQVVLDASQLADGSFVALVAKDYNRKSTCSLCLSKEERGRRPKLIQILEFPIVVDGKKLRFEPSRVILFKNSENADTVVLFQMRRHPAAVFYEIESERLTNVQLDLSKCLAISLTEDREHVVLLDVFHVCILDLYRREIVKRIKYKVNFERISRTVDTATKWSRRSHDDAEDTRTERRLSDDGLTVLLAWDATNESSIVVHPDTRVSDCEAQIRNSNGELSDFCVLSSEGTSTCFVNVHDLRHRKITVGIYSEQARKAAFSFRVVENLPEDLSQTDEINALSNVFYGVAEDRNQLVTFTAGLSQILSKKPAFEDKIRVFSIYGAKDCIPTYEQLILKRFESAKRTFQNLHDEHGVSAFSAPSSDGISIFQRAFLDRNEEMIACIKEFAKEQRYLLSLEWSPGASECEHTDVLSSALETKRDDQIERALELTCSDVAPFRSGAAVAKNSFAELLASNPEILEKALRDNLFVNHVCDLDVHVKFMQGRRRRDTADHINTSDTFLDWKQTRDKDALKQKWRKENEDILRKIESNGNKSTIPASLHFVRIEDAAKTGMQGIIRPLLLKNVPAHFFEYDVVKWIVEFKWHKIWRDRFYNHAAFYFAFLVFFTVYAILLAFTPTVRNGEPSKQASISCFFFVCFLFAFWMLCQEIRQLLAYVDDARDQARLQPEQEESATTLELSCVMWQCGHWRDGLLRYFGHSWNWLDLGSCVLLLFIIAPFQLLSLFRDDLEDCLSAFVAVESIVAYAKIWYFVQPFRHSGPLVGMISNISRECLIFLLLAFVVMLGFGVAFPVLFRGTVGFKEDDEVVDSYGSPHKSILTLFYAVLGHFDPDVYLSAGNLSFLTTPAFVLYLLGQTVLLLNLLISIMSDTFDRVKSNEESQLIRGRAFFIDACEAELMESDRKKIDEKVGKYLNVLLKVGETHDARPSDEWKGRLHRIGQMIENIFKTVTDKDNAFHAAIHHLHERMSETENVFEKAATKTHEAIQKQNERMSRVEELLKQLLERNPE